MWPGVEMKHEGGNKYSYELDDDWDSPRIIFNDGKEENALQYPGVYEKGLELEDGKTYKAEK